MSSTFTLNLYHWIAFEECEIRNLVVQWMIQVSPKRTAVEPLRYDTSITLCLRTCILNAEFCFVSSFERAQSPLTTG